MRYSLSCSFLLIALAGCIWQPDSTPNLVAYSQISFDAHVISYRSLDGSEQTITTIGPPFTGYPYGDLTNGYLADSVRYIVVNGDTAYRHPGSQLPKVYDSTSTYHLDGSRNIVTIVFPDYAIHDTTYDSLVANITSPDNAIDIGRISDGLFIFQTNLDDIAGLSSSMQLTDSNGLSFTNPVVGDTGTVDFTYDQMTTFRAGKLWAILHLDYFVENSPFYTQRHTSFDRIVEYSFQ